MLQTSFLTVFLGQEDGDSCGRQREADHGGEPPSARGKCPGTQGRANGAASEEYSHEQAVEPTAELRAEFVNRALPGHQRHGYAEVEQDGSKRQKRDRNA